MLANSSIQALVQLIDDPDDFVYQHVRNQLVSLGKEALPYLSLKQEELFSQSELAQLRYDELIQEIFIDDIRRGLQEWMRSDEKDLLEAMLLLEKLENPRSDSSEIKRQIDNLNRDLWLELNPSQTAYEQASILNKVFFKLYQFESISRKSASTKHLLLGKLIHEKQGTALSLSILYSIVAQSHNLPIYVIQLPNHFAVAMIDANRTRHFINMQNEYGVLCYIDVFAKGKMFDVADIQSHLDQSSLPHRREYFEPSAHSAIIRTVMVQLMVQYGKYGQRNKYQFLADLMLSLQ